MQRLGDSDTSLSVDKPTFVSLMVERAVADFGGALRLAKPAGFLAPLAVPLFFFVPSTRRPRFYSNRHRFQQENTECGVYAMFFIDRMLAGTSFKRFLRKHMPDNEVNRMRKRFYTV